MIRVGKVVEVYPSTGKVKVLYAEDGNTSRQLPMLTMNRELSMPNVGDKVLTLHMDNGMTKGFVLGTYYGTSTPPSGSGYRKDFGGGAYASCNGGNYLLKADGITFDCSYATVTLEDIIKRIERLEDEAGLPHSI